MAHRPLHVGAGLGLAGGIARRSTAAPDLLAWLARNLLAERERWFLWLPVGLGAGVAVYFALPVEPPVWLGAVGLLVAAVLLFWLWWRLPAPAFSGCAPGLLGVLVLLLGFAVASCAPTWSRRRCWSGGAPTNSRPRSCSWRIARAGNAFCSAWLPSRGWSGTPLRPRSE